MSDAAPFNCPRRMIDNRVADAWYVRDGWKRCSYCGSLKPSEALKRLADGDRAIPTDKSYKVYVGEYDKLYFQHFSEADKVEFIRLYNLPQGQGRMRLADPGHFYRLPYFMALKEPE